MVRRSSGDIEALPSGISETGGGAAARALEIEAANGRCCPMATAGTRLVNTSNTANRRDTSPRKIAWETP
jgi:hypothetical protein